MQMKPGRNDPCSCGSGKKYKHCCEGKAAPRAPAPTPAEFNALVTLFNTGRYAELESRASTLAGQYPGSGFAWKLLGASLQMQGKNALPAFLKTAELMPDDAEAHFNLGVAQKSLGQLDAAVASYRRALKLNPGYAEAHSNLGNALKDLGRLDDAVDSYRRALQLKPGSADAYNNLGSALKDLGQLDGAVDSYRRAVAIKPDFVAAYYNLGNALKELGLLDDAVASYRKAAEIRPDLAEAHNNLGSALKSLGQLDAAAASYRKVLEIKPDHADAHYNLGNTLKELGQLDDALASYRRAVELKPDHAEAYYILGNVSRDMGQLDDAAASYRRAVEIKPDFANAHTNLGVVLYKLMQFDEARASTQRALKLNPDNVYALSNLGNFLKDDGQLDEAMACYRRALEIEPDSAEVHSGLLFILNYSTRYSASYCLDIARQYGRMVSAKVDARLTSWQCAASPKRLRVGLVSGDLRNHPVGYFLEGLLSHIDPARIELIAYPTQLKEDELTARIRPFFSAWKPLAGKKDQEAARLIHDDGVHVLIDASGHTALNRLPVFAWKPAPVQVVWLGYFATTGMAEMDYILGDKWTLPEEESHHFVEKGWRLSGALSCMTPPNEDIKIGDLPAFRNQSITFGTLNNFDKMNDKVVSCWARILNKIPNSRLYLNMRRLRDDALKKKVFERYAAHGIAEDRLIMEVTSGRVAALNSYNLIDIALDPFPYPGGTTSYEALWMGVPILTMRGNNYLSHLGESILHNGGLSEWIAADEDEYITKAVVYSSNLTYLAELRKGLRARVLASPLFDAQLFARNFENALWGMWQANQAEYQSTAK